MMPAFLLATIVTVLVAYAAMRLSWRIPSPSARILIWAPSLLVMIAAWGLASTTTVTVRSMMIMAGLERRAPYASAMKDPATRALIEQAVVRGLSKEEGNIRDNVRSEVDQVLKDKTPRQS